MPCTCLKSRGVSDKFIRIVGHMSPILRLAVVYLGHLRFIQIEIHRRLIKAVPDCFTYEQMVLIGDTTRMFYPY